MSRFVRPETRVLTLSNGDTLTVRKRLSHGEQTDAFARMYIAGLDGSLKVNPLQAGMATVTAYLLDWSLKDDDGKTVQIAGKSVGDLESILNSLDPESFTEIKVAIETHEKEMLAEREAGKQNGGGPASSATSPSPDAAAGDTKTS